MKKRKQKTFRSPLFRYEQIDTLSPVAFAVRDELICGVLGCGSFVQEEKMREERTKATMLSREINRRFPLQAAEKRRQKKNDQSETRSRRRAPHSALDRRVESGGRDLLLASFVAPGARRGPGHAAGRHKKDSLSLFPGAKKVKATVFPLRRLKETGVGTTADSIASLYYPRRFFYITMISSSTPLARVSASCRARDFASTSFSRPAATTARRAPQRKQPLAAVAAVAAVASRCVSQLFYLPCVALFDASRRHPSQHDTESRPEGLKEDFGEAMRLRFIEQCRRRRT